MGAMALLCMGRADDVEAPQWIPLNPPPAPPFPAPEFPIPSQYLDWLFSLPLTSSPQFAWYLLSLTRGLLLPLTPTPSIANDISAPPPSSWPPLPVSPSLISPPPSFQSSAFLFLTPTQTSEVLSLLLHSPPHCRRLCEQLTAGPLLASFRIALALVSLLHASPAPLSLSLAALDPMPATLLRSYHLSPLLRPLQAKVAWALSPAAVADPPAVEPAAAEGEGEEGSDYREYWLHEVSVEQMRLLQRHLVTLVGLLQQDPAVARAQQGALLLATVRREEGGAEVNGLWGAVRDELWDRHLMREMFRYVWEER